MSEWITDAPPVPPDEFTLTGTGCIRQQHRVSAAGLAPYGGAVFSKAQTPPGPMPGEVLALAPSLTFNASGRHPGERSAGLLIRETVHVTLSTPLATAEEVHAHLVDQLNLLLRRPGMFGGELALRILLDHLLFVERQPGAFTQQQRDWEDRGLWSAGGVTGAFLDLIPGRNYEYGMASVYAEFAQRRGWLEPDGVLAEKAYEALKDRVRQWAREDHTGRM
jgi:hypothetical protein